MINQILQLLSGNICLKIVALMVVLDSMLGGLRALKEQRLNSNCGINGAIRKTAMIISIAALMAFDIMTHFDLLFMVPEKYITVIGIGEIGTCEFFSLLFTLYEIVSILKNMVLCGLPIPPKLKSLVDKFLDEMTEELAGIE